MTHHDGLNELVAGLLIEILLDGVHVEYGVESKRLGRRVGLRRVRNRNLGDFQV